MIEYVMRIIQNVFNNVNTAAETPLGETVVSIIVIIVVGIIVCIIASGIGMIVASIFKGIRINLAGMLAAVIAEFVLLGFRAGKGADRIPYWRLDNTCRACRLWNDADYRQGIRLGKMLKEADGRLCVLLCRIHAEPVCGISDVVRNASGERQ